MYKQNQNIRLVAKDGSATQTIIYEYQAKKLFASTNHFDFANIKSSPPKTKIKKYRL